MSAPTKVGIGKRNPLIGGMTDFHYASSIVESLPYETIFNISKVVVAATFNILKIDSKRFLTS
jgi:hypothetical protein